MKMYAMIIVPTYFFTLATFSKVIQGRPQIKRNMFRWKRFGLSTHAVWCLGTERTSSTEKTDKTNLCCHLLVTPRVNLLWLIYDLFTKNVDFKKRYLFCCITYFISDYNTIQINPSYWLINWFFPPLWLNFDYITNLKRKWSTDKQ